MKAFIITDEHGRGLSFVCGVHYWNMPGDFENIMDFTRFSNVEETVEFIYKNNIKTESGVYPYIHKMVLKIK
jgi:hypothetical protein